MMSNKIFPCAFLIKPLSASLHCINLTCETLILIKGLDWFCENTSHLYRFVCVCVPPLCVPPLAEKARGARHSRKCARL